MRTSQQWWADTKSDTKLLADWLVKQYRGEVTASRRILAFVERFEPAGRARRTLEVIAEQEAMHASWVLDLLKARGVDPSTEGAEERYWKETLPEIESFETGAAVGAHAEAMRLERIRVIAADREAPQDIQLTFVRILGDEVFHERAFREMAGEEAMARTQGSHERGMALLGLTA